MKEINFLDLAKQTRHDGKPQLFWIYFKNHARVMRKKRAKEKAAASAALNNMVGVSAQVY